MEVLQEFPEDFDPIGHFPDEWPLDTFPNPNPYFPETPRKVHGLMPAHGTWIMIAGILIAFGAICLATWPVAHPVVVIVAAFVGAIAAGSGYRIRADNEWKDAWRWGRIVPAHVVRGAQSATGLPWGQVALAFAPEPVQVLARYVSQKYAPPIRPDQYLAAYVDLGEIKWTMLSVGRNWEHLPPGPHFWIVIDYKGQVWPTHVMAPGIWSKIEMRQEAFFWKWAALMKAYPKAKARQA